MRQVYEDQMIHSPRTIVELESTLETSSRRGFPGCIGYLDGVHVHWDKCPSQMRHLCTGKSPYPTLGWQCAVNHRRRFISVSNAHMGSVNDKAAVKSDDFVTQLRNDPLYKDWEYFVYDSNGVRHVEKGLWLNVDGGYITIPECLVGDPDILRVDMNYWTSVMESERKHVECAFGILKARFRLLKLPVRIHTFSEIDDLFHTCCILHNMCLDFDGGDDGWNLGYSTRYNNDPCETYGGFIPQQDGYFSDDDNHRFYWVGGNFYNIGRELDYSSTGNASSPVTGSKHDTQKFHSKRNKLVKHWMYMYRQQIIDWEYK